MNFLHEMNFGYMYVAVSLVVAILMWVETSWTLKNGGKMPMSSVFAVISLITSSWVVISGLAMYFVDFDNLAMSVPVCFAIYFVVSWIYGSKVISLADIDDPKDLVLPAKYLNFCRSFALAFAMLCLFVLSAPYLPMAKWLGVP